MNDDQKADMTLDKLEELLNIYGSDLSRMPEHLRDAVNELTKSNEQAKKLVLESSQLEKALTSLVPEVSFDLEKLEQNIMSKIATKQKEHKVQQQDNSATIVDMAEWKSDVEQSNPEPSKQNPFWKAVLPAPHMMGTGLIAASLISGIFFGSLGGLEMIWGESNIITIASLDLTDDILYLSTEDSLISDTGLNLLSGTTN